MKTTINNTYNVRDGPQQDGTWQYGPNAGSRQHAYFTMANAVPAAADYLKLGLTTYEFLAEATAATAGKVKVTIGNDIAATRTNLVAEINAHDPYFSAVATGTAGETLIYAKAPGLTGLLGSIAITDAVTDADYLTIGEMIYEIDLAADGVTSGRVAVVPSALTKLVVAAALVAKINATHPYVYAVNTSATDGGVAFYTKLPYIKYGQATTATLTYPLAPCMYIKEDMGNTTFTAADGHTVISKEFATAGNGLFTPSTTNMVGGVEAVAGKVFYGKWAATTADVTHGSVDICLDFIPTAWIVQVYTSAGKETQKGDFTIFDGVVTVNSATKVLNITKGTNHPFANTDVIHVIAWE